MLPRLAILAVAFANLHLLMQDDFKIAGLIGLGIQLIYIVCYAFKSSNSTLGDVGVSGMLSAAFNLVMFAYLLVLLQQQS